MLCFYIAGTVTENVPWLSETIILFRHESYVFISGEVLKNLIPDSIFFTTLVQKKLNIAMQVTKTESSSTYTFFRPEE